jgi:hypothetical protein
VIYVVAAVPAGLLALAGVAGAVLGWHVFGTLVLVFLIMLVADVLLGIIFVALPLVWRSGLSTVISGTVVAPFLALVVTLIYYRLGGADPGQAGSAAGDAGWRAA